MPTRKASTDGDALVKAFIADLPGWQRDVGRRLDALVAREVPDVKRAIKWSMPVYGREGQGWFAFLAAYTKHVSFGFYEGASLTPVPPHGEGKAIRHLKLLGPDDLDEAQVAEWVRQAAALKGWGSA